MEHVIGEEKYECEILNVVVRASSILVGIVWCDVLRGFFLWVLFLYL